MAGAIGRADGAFGDPNHQRGLSADRASWVNSAVSDGLPMGEVVKQFKPSVMLGLAAQPAGLFSEQMCRDMAANHARPIIMPMSNPTTKAECTPEQAYNWTEGRAIVATGSPFDPVTLADGRTFIPSQCNNMCAQPTALEAAPRPYHMPRAARRTSPRAGTSSPASVSPRPSPESPPSPTRCSTRRQSRVSTR